MIQKHHCLLWTKAHLKLTEANLVNCFVVSLVKLDDASSGLIKRETIRLMLYGSRVPLELATCTSGKALSILKRFYMF